MRLNRTGLLVPALVVFIAGCTNNGPHNHAPSAAASVDAGPYRLAAEPAAARGVSEVRQSAQDGDEVVVVGRVGGSAKPLTDGRASFLMVDPSLKPTEGCECPWDFCEYSKEELLAATVAVKVVDDQGRSLPAGARELFGLKELSTVVVKGKARRDDKGNLTVLASGLYVRKDTP
jgi:hypothetical protein